jgi:hypothetical protein
MLLETPPFCSIGSFSFPSSYGMQMQKVVGDGLRTWVRHEMDRGERGDLKDVLTSGEARREVPDFGGDSVGGRLGLQAMAVLQQTICDGEMLVGHGSAS